MARVDLENKAKDIKCWELASIGWTYKAIANVVGYSEAQVAYRVRKAGVSPRDWRSGNISETKAIGIVQGLGFADSIMKSIRERRAAREKMFKLKTKRSTFSER